MLMGGAIALGLILSVFDIINIIRDGESRYLWVYIATMSIALGLLWILSSNYGSSIAEVFHSLLFAR